MCFNMRLSVSNDVKRDSASLISVFPQHIGIRLLTAQKVGVGNLRALLKLLLELK